MNFFKNDWDVILSEEFNKEYFVSLMDKVNNAYKTSTIYPEKNKVFSALKLTAYKDVKVVILGQDPYHEPGQAHGVSFSVLPGQQVPPSLVNIYKEITNDLGCYTPNNGYLIKWCKQGVLMLNTVLTVQKGLANSHKGWGWEIFTDEIIKKLNERKDPIIFLLWGRNAISKQKFITNPNHLVLTSVHPSPLSAYAGFFGCKHFSKTNEFLKTNNKTIIDWQIENI